MPRLRLTQKLTAAFLALGLLPCAVLGVVATHQASEDLSREAFGRLENLRFNKKLRIETLVSSWQADLATALDIAARLPFQPGADDSANYAELLSASLPPRGYLALFIADADGKVIITVGAPGQPHPAGDQDFARVRRILAKSAQSASFAFDDFSAGGTEPYALAALPLVRDGRVRMIAAAMISTTPVDAVMTPRHGVGATGEAYLVGPDFQVRSNSRLDPVHRSVAASFANPEAGRVDTVAVREALAGRTGTRLIDDYRGQRVLSAFMPMPIGNTVWALVVEQDAAESLATVRRMRGLMLIIGAIAFAVVLAGGIALSRRLARPIVSLTAAMKGLAAGDTSVFVPASDRGDEIGEMAKTVRVFRDNAIEIDRLQAGQALGDDLFDSVLAYLCRTLQVEGAFLGILDDGVMRTVRARCDGGATHFQFDCCGCSCEAAMRGGQTAILRDAPAAFPNDPIIRNWNAEAIVALSLLNSRAKPFGILAVVSRRPLPQKEQALALLRLFAARVAAELERKIYEEDLLRSLDELRTAQEKAESAVREAKLADEAKTRFLAAASHDLRQPLQSLNLFVSALRNTDDERKRAYLLDHIQTGLDSMGNLLGSLLDISKLDAGLVVPQLTEFRVDDLFAELEKEFAPLTEEKTLELRVVRCQCTIRSDRVLLGNILRNLLANAIRYTPSGQKILLGARLRDGMAALSVIDSGRGIAADQLPLIFQEFYQVDNPARDRSQGLGLGLSIVKKLAALLNHGVEVTSRPGKGSTFTILVPLVKPGMTPDHGQGVAEEAAEGHVVPSLQRP